ncbi:MAG: helix-turn-helix transcriptional regulator [Deltaproteobacteria bacterium]|nr:helix-turn-helix transcriptional regulator [Deltaproteobacteria bacterium]
MNTIRSRDELTKELQDREIRDFYVSDHINIGIPLQVRALRKQRGWTQNKLAQLTGMKQERISAIENPNYKHKFTLSILMKLASAFDVALIVRFAPISELVKWELALSPERLEAVSFDEDPYFKPPVVNVSCQVGLVLGASMAVQSQETIKESPETKKKGKLYIVDAGQKTTKNKMDAYQEEKNMLSYEDNLMRANQ